MEKFKTVGVIGHLGVVGGAVFKALSQVGGLTVHGYDIKNSFNVGERFLDSEVIFICLPTNSYRPLDIIYDTLLKLDDYDYDGVIIIKSTILPGSVITLSEDFGDMDIFYMPEFLKECTAFDDFVWQPTYIMAYDPKEMEDARANAVCDQMLALFGDIKLMEYANHEERYQSDTVPLKDPEIILSNDPLSVEYLKYFHNCFNALRVTYGNIFHEMISKSISLAVNYHETPDSTYADMLGMYHDVTGTSLDYLHVSSKQRGYGGPCLPKDTRQMAQHYQALLEFTGFRRNNIFNLMDTFNKFMPITVPEGMRPNKGEKVIKDEVEFQHHIKPGDSEVRELKVSFDPADEELQQMKEEIIKENTKFLDQITTEYCNRKVKEFWEGTVYMPGYNEIYIHDIDMDKFEMAIQSRFNKDHETQLLNVLGRLDRKLND